MKPEEIDYVKGLTFGRQLDYLQHKWGAHPELTLQLIADAKGGPVLVGSCALLNFVLAAELMHPPPVVLTGKVTKGTDLQEFVLRLLNLWDVAVADNFEEQNTPPSP